MKLPYDPKLSLEDVPCPLCGERQEEVVTFAERVSEPSPFRLVTCRACTMTYLNPRPDRPCIHQFYQESYKPYQPRQVERGRISKRRHATVSGDRDSLTSLPFHGEGKLLDVGCGSGWFAQRMLLRGWKVTGLDFSEHAVKQARRDYSFPVFQGTLPHPVIRPCSFDVINLGCVLEHVHEPHRFLEAAQCALRPGGYLAVTVPNIESWSVRHFGRHCFHLDLPRHLLHFTPATLRRMLEMHGLQVSSLRMLARASWMRRTLEAVCADPGTSRKQQFLARLGRLTLLRSLLTRWTVRKGEADAMLALAHKPALKSMDQEVGTRVDSQRLTLKESECQTDAERVHQDDGVLSTH